MWNSKRPAVAGRSHICARVCKPNSVVEDNLSGTTIAGGLERHSLFAQGTALHPGKDFAVSLPLKGFVTVRTSYARREHTTGVTRYLSALLLVLVFGLSSPKPEGLGAVFQRAVDNYTTQNKFPRYTQFQWWSVLYRRSDL